MSTSCPTPVPEKTAKYILETDIEEPCLVFRIYRKTDERLTLVDEFTDFNDADEEVKTLIRHSKTLSRHCWP